MAKDLANGVRALSGISLTIRRGERVGIVGRNGAGKSTLLKLLAGDFPPSSGSLEIKGEIYCLFPGSVSFAQEQSTLENARQYLAYLPISQEEIDARIQDIRDFTELGEYFTQPVKNLSLGMRVRAEFAVATARMADIVIIDEVLGAGDIYWSEKIARRMELLCGTGTTLILVSHSLDQINRYCDRAVWIERGEVVLDGVAIEVTKRYEGFLERLSWQTDDLDDKTISLHHLATELGNQILPDSGQIINRWPGRGDVIVTGVWLNEQATSQLKLTAQSRLNLRMHLQAQKAGNYRMRYLLTFWSSQGKRLAVVENDADTVEMEAGGVHTVSLTLCGLGLAQGTYHLTIAVIDSGEGDSSANETLSRLDVLYKSFSVSVTGVDGDQITSLFVLPLISTI